MNSGGVLKRLRRQAGLSQQDLAVALGVHGSAVSQWERNINQPRRPMVERLDELLHADGALLAAYGYISEGSSGSPSAEPPSELLEEVRGLAAQVRQVAEQQAAMLAALQGGGFLPPGEVTRRRHEVRSRLSE